MSFICKITLSYMTICYLLCQSFSVYAGNIVSLAEFDPDTCEDLVINLYLYDKTTQSIQSIKKNCHDIGNFGSLNPDSSLYIYGETLENGESVVIIYNIFSKAKSVIVPLGGMNGPFTGFNASGKIIFVGKDGTLKQMDVDGSNIFTVAVPEDPYSFGHETFFVMSPDRSKIIIAEGRVPCPFYEQCNYQRLVLLDLKTLERTIITQEYLGDWNIAMWKQDSSGFYYIFHEFQSSGDPVYRTIFSGISCGGDVTTTDLSNSDLAQTGTSPHNFLLYPKSDNLLLSLLDHGLYDGKTGSLVVEIPSAPNIFNPPKLFGSDAEGIYFSDPDGGNFIVFGDGDLDGDGDIDGLDIFHMAGEYSICSNGCLADIDADSDVDDIDLRVLAAGVGLGKVDCAKLP